MVKKFRADQLLFERGLAESRSQAQRLIMAGQVRADGQIVPKPSTTYTPDVQLGVDLGPSFVSRGGEKLEAAFNAFDLAVAGRICADVGASTGGFTDCLLQHGALKVYAIDVGKGVLHWKLRNDPRVVVMEGVNVRHVMALPETASFVSIDASFISVKLVLPVVLGWFPQSETTGARAGEVVVLIKPQFEAGRKEVARGKGVIRDPKIHRQVLTEVLTHALALGYSLRGLVRSPVLGPKGNVEFLGWMQTSEKKDRPDISIEFLVANVIDIE